MKPLTKPQPSNRHFDPTEQTALELSQLNRRYIDMHEAGMFYICYAPNIYSQARRIKHLRIMRSWCLWGCFIASCLRLVGARVKATELKRKRFRVYVTSVRVYRSMYGRSGIDFYKPF